MFWILGLMMIMFSCGKDSIETKSDIDRLVDRKNSYIKQAEQLGDNLYQHRCDRLTFNALLSAFGKKQDLSIFEYDDIGKFHRDIKHCYPHASRSEISLDGILMLLHHVKTHNDKELFNRLFDYGEKHDWIMGDGPKEYTNIYVLVPTIYKMADINLITDIDSVLKGYKGHIAAMFILLKGRVYGKINILELQALEMLVKSAPENPLYSAIYHRFKDGDQRKTIELLNAKFTDEFPTETSVFHWGSVPASIYFITTVGILENM